MLDHPALTGSRWCQLMSTVPGLCKRPPGDFIYKKPLFPNVTGVSLSMLAVISHLKWSSVNIVYEEETGILRQKDFCIIFYRSKYQWYNDFFITKHDNKALIGCIFRCFYMAVKDGSYCGIQMSVNKSYSHLGALYPINLKLYTISLLLSKSLYTFGIFFSFVIYKI